MIHKTILSVSVTGRQDRTSEQSDRIRICLGKSQTTKSEPRTQEISKECSGDYPPTGDNFEKQVFSLFNSRRHGLGFANAADRSGEQGRVLFRGTASGTVEFYSLCEWVRRNRIHSPVGWRAWARESAVWRSMRTITGHMLRASSMTMNVGRMSSTGLPSLLMPE